MIDKIQIYYIQNNLSKIGAYVIFLINVLFLKVIFKELDFYSISTGLYSFIERKKEYRVHRYNNRLEVYKNGKKEKTETYPRRECMSTSRMGEDVQCVSVG